MEKMNANFFKQMMDDLRMQGRMEAIKAIMDPEEHMDAVEECTYHFMLGARMAFNMIASRLFSSDEIEMDMSVFEDEPEEERLLVPLPGDKKLLN